jgi:hypothetical protein
LHKELFKGRYGYEPLMSEEFREGNAQTTLSMFGVIGLGI